MFAIINIVREEKMNAAESLCETYYDYYLIDDCRIECFSLKDWKYTIFDWSFFKSRLNNCELNYSKLTRTSFGNQVDLWNEGKWNNKSQLVLFKNIPKLYLDIGLKDSPMTLSASKIDRIVNSSGIKAGEYHGLGIERVKQLPQVITNPLRIIESSTVKGSIVVVTGLLDTKSRVVIVSIAIDGTGHIEVVDKKNKTRIKRLQSNVVTSAYGRNNYETWMQNNKDRMIYDKNYGIIKKRIDGKWLQLPSGINSSTCDNTTSLLKKQVALVINGFM